MSALLHRLPAALLLVLCVLASLCAAQTRDDYEKARKQMVAEFVEGAGVRNPRVLEAMRTVPRHEFVPAALKSKAYTDAAWSIGYKQTISPPFVVAYMTETLDPQPGDKVLEIGTGSGYQAAVLSHLVKDVYSIEIVEPLGRSAARRLKRLGYKNVKTMVGDGYLGWPEYAPFDKIIVTCSPESVPKPLIEQLKEGGKMVIPVGELYRQDIYLMEKKDGKLVRKPLIPTLFVPMTGRSEKERVIKPDPLNPQLFNGGFEQLESSGQAEGWHYQRQMTLLDTAPPEGRHFARFQNEDRGRLSQALQGIPLDGQRLSTLNFRFMARSKEIVEGSSPSERAGLWIYFYDELRRLIGQEQVARVFGTSDWHTVEGTTKIPPKARHAIFQIGLHGAVGRLDVDDVRLTVGHR
ncbi:MAG TPA: protein-L-isoaspartate(D-aspartate) O-methyltransferase [Planctomycetaceae bacterium]|jgi:protein-L-isoaspartate(D-aspartate) O-methyltransferase|nr:protein-L-isoaspartate(D-aspartate) O-methyltransferase [Planctomycetaceae bacterium]